MLFHLVYERLQFGVVFDWQPSDVLCDECYLVGERSVVFWVGRNCCCLLFSSSVSCFVGAFDCVVVTRWMLFGVCVGWFLLGGVCVCFVFRVVIACFVCWLVLHGYVGLGSVCRGGP